MRKVSFDLSWERSLWAWRDLGVFVEIHPQLQQFHRTPSFAAVFHSVAAVNQPLFAFHPVERQGELSWREWYNEVLLLPWATRGSPLDSVSLWTDLCTWLRPADWLWCCTARSGCFPSCLFFDGSPSVSAYLLLNCKGELHLHISGKPPSALRFYCYPSASLIALKMQPGEEKQKHHWAAPRSNPLYRLVWFTTLFMEREVVLVFILASLIYCLSQGAVF